MTRSIKNKGEWLLPAWPRHVHLDYTFQCYEVAAIFITIATSPKLSQADAARLQSALCREQIKTIVRSNPLWATIPQLIRPMYWLNTDCTDVDPKDTQKAFRALEHRVQLFGVAGKIANGILGAKLHSGSFGLPSSVSNISVDALLEYTAEEHGQSVDDRNARNRVWTEFRPVMHFAAACRLLDLVWRQQNKNFLLTELYQNATLLIDILCVSEMYRGLISQCGEFNISADEMVSLTWNPNLPAS